MLSKNLVRLASVESGVLGQNVQIYSRRLIQEDQIYSRGAVFHHQIGKGEGSGYMAKEFYSCCMTIYTLHKKLKILNILNFLCI